MAKTNVWARRKARRALVQATYQWQMTGTPVAALTREFTDSGALQKADTEFFEEVLGAVVRDSAKLDALVEPLLDRKVSELDKVELALLRLGACELQGRIDVPFKVVLDEYVALAKLFGAEQSHKYINGVLDKLAPDLRALEVAHQGRGTTPADPVA